jgi:hypothetical protein
MVCEKRDKRYKSPSYAPARRSFADRGGSARTAEGQTGRSFCLRTAYWRTSRMSPGGRVLWLGMASGRVVWCFPSCQNCSIKRTHWAHPAERVDFALRRHALAGRRHAADRRNPSLRCHITFCYTQVITRTTADAFPVVGGRCTGRARRCKAKQGRRGKTALTC